MVLEKKEFLHFSEIKVLGVEELETTIRVYWHNGKGPNDGVQRSEMYNSVQEAEQFYDKLGKSYAKLLVGNYHEINSFGDTTTAGKCRLLAEKDGFLNPASTYTKGRGRCRLSNGKYNYDD